jgi:hypothetical protein
MASLTITCQLISVRNKRIEELVDNVNSVIDNIQSKDDVRKATLLRNNAIKIINENEAKINSIKSILERISLILSVLDISLFIYINIHIIILIIIRNSYSYSYSYSYS